MNAVWYRFRAELRTRWRTWLGLALLVGLAGGIVLTAAAGARRTGSAYDRFVDESEAFDVLVVPDSLDVETSIEDFYPRVASLPQVEVFGVVVGMFLLPGSSNAGDLVDNVQFAATDDKAFQKAFRPNMVEGRFPDPRRVDEVAIDPRYARTAGLDPGDEIIAIAIDVEALLAKYGSETAAMEAVEAGQEGERIRFTVTGIAVTPDNLVVDEGFETGYAYYTPAFYERYPGSLAGYSGAAVKLKGGAADEQAFRRRVEDLVPDETIEFQSRALIDETVDRAVRPYTVALWAFAAAIALTAILILGQAVARQRFLDAVEDSPLAAIGCSRGQLLGLVMLRTVTFAVPGALLAVMIAAVASPIMPLGPARDAEVDAGFAIDVLTLGLGGVAVTFLVFLLALIAARRLILRGDTEREDRDSAIARLVARIGLGPSAANGIRFAVESGRGRTAVPARTTLITSTVAVATVLAALTFAAGLDRLIETPRLFGVTWQLEAEGGGESIEQSRRDRERIDAALGAEKSVDGWSRLSASRLLLDGLNVPAVAFTPVEGDVVPTIAAGRRPRSDDELALGKRTMDRLGVGIGDSVHATFRDENRDLRVVGRVVLPGLGNYPGGDKTSPGDGALVTAAALRELSPAFTFSRNVVRLDDGADVSAVRRRVAGNIGAGPDDFRVRGVQQPADVVDLERVRSTPVILAAMLGLLGAATIAHALVTTIRRRRRDLAMLKTLGFTFRQVSGAIAWQASTIAVVAVVIGVPLGVAAGRAAWSFLAQSVGILSEPAVAWLAVALALPILLVGANLVAAVPAWLAARTRPAAVLRSE